MKIIQLKNCSIGIANCGACPFFEYDTMRGEYHTCKIKIDGHTLSVGKFGIPTACPLKDNDSRVRFIGCEYDGTKGCDTWQL
jgi:hypothetical protein